MGHGLQCASCTTSGRHLPPPSVRRESSAEERTSTRSSSVDPRFMEKRPRFPREEGAERSVRMSTTTMRTRLTAAGRIAAMASMPTWPRCACTQAPARKTAPTMQQHGDLVLPVGAGLEKVARKHAVREHERRGTAGDHAEPRTVARLIQASAASTMPSSPSWTTAPTCGAPGMSTPWLTGVHPLHCASSPSTGAPSPPA